MAGDFAARAQYMREAFNMGALSVDEIRAQMGYNPLPDGLGNKRFVQVNMQLLDAFTMDNPTAQKDMSEPMPADEPQMDDDAIDGNDGPSPADAAVTDAGERSASEVLFQATLRRLAAIEADGILERRNKPAKLAAWLDAHAQRMKTELCDAAQATGRDIEAFVVSWMEESKDRLLECHRSGTQYEEVLASWTERANLSVG
jgi:hypothetical protein